MPCNALGEQVSKALCCHFLLGVPGVPCSAFPTLQKLQNLPTRKEGRAGLPDCRVGSHLGKWGALHTAFIYPRNTKSLLGDAGYSVLGKARFRLSAHPQGAPRLVGDQHHRTVSYVTYFLLPTARIQKEGLESLPRGLGILCSYSAGADDLGWCAHISATLYRRRGGVNYEFSIRFMPNRFKMGKASCSVQ